MAAWYEAHARDGVYNAHYDRPAVLDLLGPVGGQDVLDAGCGPGWYALALLDRGARVVALDGTAAMVERARARVGDRARVLLHDLERPLTPLPDVAFDAVVLALVVHHVDDRAGLLAELFRVLRPGGRLVLSTHHPLADWRRCGGSYFAVEKVALPFAAGAYQVPAWRQPLSFLLAELLAPGFVLERLVEPLPDASVRTADPQAWAALTTAPAFLALRLRRPG